MAWAKNGTPDTLGSAGDTITISDLTATKFNQLLLDLIRVTSVVNYKWRFGNGSVDTGSNYSGRRNVNGGTDSTTINQTSIIQNSDNYSEFTIGYAINISAEEKLLIAFGIDSNAAGAANAPFRSEVVGKWVNISNQFDNVNMFNTTGGSYDTSSNLSALGTD